MGVMPYERKPDSEDHAMDDQSLEKSLRAETLKWLSKADEKSGRAVPVLQTNNEPMAEGTAREDDGLGRFTGGPEEFIENINAYLSDARYFLMKNDLIRAFEAVVWAWAWLEIGERTGLIRMQN
jgi:hypothetical protein